MKAFFISLIMAVTVPARGLASVGDLQAWNAGKVVSISEVKEFGMEKCFCAVKIPDKVFARMKGKSFKSYCTVARNDLRYVKVLHYNANNQICVGELVCHKDVANDMVDIFRNLFKVKYPIERMVLIDNYSAIDEPSMEANNTSCFNFRFVANTKVLSNHSMGKAIDVNPLYNPYVKKRKDGSVMVNPESGRPYADRSKTFKYKIDKNDSCYKEFIRHGFSWGGNWKSLKDYQHFEKK